MSSLESLKLKEELITVPISLVRQSCGIGFDIGGSLFKAIYRTKENIQELNESSDGFGHLTLLSVAGEHLKQAVEFIANRACINKGSVSNPIYCTGMGNIVYRKLLSEKFQVKICSLGEFDCAVKSFLYLSSHIPKSELLYSLDREAAKLSDKRVEKFLNFMSHASMHEQQNLKSIVTHNGNDGIMILDEVGNDSSSLSLSELNKHMYPCILGIFGSATAFCQVNADGSHRFLDGTVVSGKSFLGLGSLLTGAQTFEELIDLASTGDDRNVHVYAQDLTKSYQEVSAELTNESEMNDFNQGTELYQLIESLDGSIIYGFGKCSGKQLHELNKADIAKALLVQIIQNQVHILSMVCATQEIFKVYLCGSFFNSDLTRSIATTEIVYRNRTRVLTGQIARPMEFEFLKVGSYLGAFGTLLAKYEKNS